MDRYLIEVIATGLILFDGAARDGQGALDEMAECYGYADYADMCGCELRGTDECRAELKISTLDWPPV